MNTKYEIAKKYETAKAICLIVAVGVFFITVKNTKAAYPPQCGAPNATGAQSGCTHDNDPAILSSQCAPIYGSSTCSSMSGYLSAMRNDCLFVGDAGVDCDMITSGGFYGYTANSFALYLEANPGTANISAGPAANTGTGTNLAPVTGSLEFPTNVGLPDPDPVDPIKSILTSFFYWFLLVVGIISMISFAISGLQYFFAAGNQSDAEVAKRNMTFSILGIIAALSGYIVVRAVDAALRANVFF